MIREIEENIRRLAGEEIRKKVMEGSEITAASANKKKVAEWVKGVIERLDALIDEETRIQIMENCGYNCASVNKRVIERTVARRKKYESVDEFLEAEQQKPPKGMRFEREGNVVYHFYTPRSFTRPTRCYCGLVNSLDGNLSLTYCHCSKGFVMKYWENILERPVKVELLQSTLSGAEECKFSIHL